MAGLIPAIHVFAVSANDISAEDMDAASKCGDDGE
jgi:hypothetical protein